MMNGVPGKSMSGERVVRLYYVVHVYNYICIYTHTHNLTGQVDERREGRALVHVYTYIYLLQYIYNLTGQVDERREGRALVRQVERHHPGEVVLRAALEAVAQCARRPRLALA